MKLKQAAVGVCLSFLLTGTCLGISPAALSYKPMELVQTGTDGTLVFSDCPEYVSTYGILTEGTVSAGKGRIYYYHVNESGSPGRLVIYGESDGGGTLKIRRFLRGEPSRGYLYTGQTLAFREATDVGDRNDIRRLTAGKKTVLAEDNPTGVAANDLVSGILEIETERPIRFGVAFLPMTDHDGLEEELRKANPIFSLTGDMRGTFPMEIRLENEIWKREEGPKEIIIGDGVRDRYLTDMEQTGSGARQNKGNYGVTYFITIRSKGTGSYEVYINPQGGAYPATFCLRQRGKAPLVRQMRNRGTHWFGDGTKEDIQSLGRWNFGEDLQIRFIPPGSGFHPIRILLVPEADKETS